MAESSSTLLQKSSLVWRIKGIRNHLKSELFTLCGTQWQLFLQFQYDVRQLCVFLLKGSDEEIKTTGRILIQAHVKGRKGVPIFQRCKDVDISVASDTIIWSSTLIYHTAPHELAGDDGSVIFIFNFEYKSGHSDNFGREEKSVQTSLTVDPLASLESLSVDLKRLMDDQGQTDVTLRCGDSTVAAHRVILSARSEVFSAMLRSDTSESPDGVITIVDIDPPILEQLVRYIYSGGIPDLSSDTAKRLYEAAVKYAMETLKAQCSGFMKENLTEENACDVLAVADAHSDADLKECAVAFIVDSDLLLKEKWTNFCSEHSALAVEVYARAYAAKCSSNPVVPKVVPKDPRLYVYADLNRNRISPLQDNFLSCDNL